MHRTGRLGGLSGPLLGDEPDDVILRLLEEGSISLEQAKQALRRNKELSQDSSRT